MSAHDPYRRRRRRTQPLRTDDTEHSTSANQPLLGTEPPVSGVVADFDNWQGMTFEQAKMTEMAREWAYHDQLSIDWEAINN